MSYDPYASGSEPPEYDYARPAGNSNNARQRVQAPGIALIVTGILNLLGSGWGIFNTTAATLVPADQLHQHVLDIYQKFPEAQAEVKKMSANEFKNVYMLVGWGGVALGLVSASLTLAGGIRILSLKSYALGICGAICAAIPCLSFSGCCCFGEIIGIWALVVLINAEVRAAFQ